MGVTTVLLTGAGGAATPTLIAHLRQQGYRVLAVDCDPHAAGLYLADKGFVIPRGDDANWLPVMRRLCIQENGKALIPLVDEELLPALELEQDGVMVLCPRWEFVQTCLDKWECMKTLILAGVRVPNTVCGDEFDIFYPLVIKPRRGRGSRGVKRIDNEFGFWRYLAKHPGINWDQTLRQEYIDGPEYTVSVVCWRDDVVRAVVPKRIISKQGMTRLAVTERNEVIDTTCRRIAEALEPGGPFNVQGRMQDGKFYIFEINPRFSGTVNLTIQAGCDEVGGLLSLALMGKWRTDNDPGQWQDGRVLVRQYQDVVMDRLTFEDSVISDISNPEN